MADDPLDIAPGIRIPPADLVYRASRAGGPGGQHGNRSATRVELVWDLAGSAALGSEERSRLLARLAHRLDSAGRLRLVSGASRSQLRNREEVTERLRRLVAAALVPPKVRRPTRPTAASKARCREQTRRRSARRRERRPPDREE